MIDVAPDEIGEQVLSQIGFSKALNGGLGKAIEAENGADKHVRKVDSGAKSLFAPDGEAEPMESTKELHPLHDEAANFGINPEPLADNLTGQLSNFAQKAPHVTEAVSQSVAKGLNFLDLKRPPVNKPGPLDAETKLSQHQISMFNRYAKVVDDPHSVFADIKKGMVTPQHIETLSTVYPSVYNAMKVAAMDKMTSFLTKNDVSSIPYKTRLGLSQFLGQNLSSTMSQPAIAANQMALAGIAQQKAQQESASKAGMAKMKSIGNDRTSAQQASDRRSPNGTK